MAPPTHDTDLAKIRWQRHGWRNFELWEKVEKRINRKKRNWILLTFLIFMILSAYPVFLDRWVKKDTLVAIRKLAEEINWIKHQAAVQQKAYKIIFAGGNTLDYHVETSLTCRDAKKKVIRRGTLLKGSKVGKYLLLSAQEGEQLSVPGLVTSFCYDFVWGSENYSQGNAVTGMGIIPAADMNIGVTHRISVLVFEGESAKLSFN